MSWYKACRAIARALSFGSLAIVTLWIPVTNTAQAQWAEQPAQLTIREFLEGFYKLDFRREETGSGLNDYNLVSFYPSAGHSTGVVFIIQTWHDERVSEVNLRREMRVLAESMFSQFEASLRLPTVARRWRPERSVPNFVVRHVRHSDLRETLAVTVEKGTFFDAESIRKAEALVRARGGVWSW